MAQSYRTDPPVEADLKILPRWACVAFAARCARRVQPLFDQIWPSAPAEHREAIDKAIKVAESSARAASTIAFPIDNANNALRAARAPKVAASYAARTAANAAEAAANEAADAAYFAFQAAINAANASAYATAATAETLAVVANRAASVRAMWSDVDYLRAEAFTKQLTEDSPVDPDSCGPLWPKGVETLWPDDEASLLAAVLAASPQEQPVPAFLIAWDPELVSPEEYAEVVAIMRELIAATEGAGKLLRLHSTDFGVKVTSGVFA